VDPILVEERDGSGSPRRKLLLTGLGVLVLAAAVTVVLSRDGGAPERTLLGEREEGGDEVALSEIPSFRFTATRPVLLPTRARSVQRRDKVVGKRAATTAAAALTDLYTEAFLDPANWRIGSYTDAFGVFSAGASRRARERTAVLTAGPDAGGRFEQILPVSGSIDTRILLDRSGKPALVLSAVTFRAEAVGPEPMMLRSEGRFFFQLVQGRWKIVSFLVNRNDRPKEAA
jgi:hypothetical protein